MPGLTNRFSLTDLVRRGGMGTVYRATDRTDGRPVAIKRIAPEHANDPQVSARFAAEIEALRSLSLPGIPRLLDDGVDEQGAPYLVMEWLPGRTLSETLPHETPLDLSRVVEIASGLLDRLAALHDNGWLHGDIKPGNILVHGRLISLIDLGLARRLDDRRAAGSEICGTPPYLAPELACGHPPSASSDLYAAGVLLYELVAGEDPCDGTTPLQIVSREPVATSRTTHASTNPRLERMLARAVARHPDERFLSAAGMREALLDAVAVEPGRTTARLPGLSVHPAPSEAGPLAEARRAVADALRSGNSTEMITAYLELGRRLVTSGDLAGAHQELVEAIDLVTVGEGLHAAGAPAGFWKLLCALAAVQQRTGARAESIETLHVALRNAVLTHDPDGVRLVQRVRERLHHPPELPPLQAVRR